MKRADMHVGQEVAVSPHSGRRARERASGWRRATIEELGVKVRFSAVQNGVRIRFPEGEEFGYRRAEPDGTFIVNSSQIVKPWSDAEEAVNALAEAKEKIAVARREGAERLEKLEERLIAAVALGGVAWRYQPNTHAAPETDRVLLPTETFEALLAAAEEAGR